MVVEGLNRPLANPLYSLPPRSPFRPRLPGSRFRLIPLAGSPRAPVQVSTSRWHSIDWRNDVTATSLLHRVRAHDVTILRPRFIFHPPFRLPHGETLRGLLKASPSLFNEPPDSDVCRCDSLTDC